jgi:hypothetical protein
MTRSGTAKRARSCLSPRAVRDRADLKVGPYARWTRLLARQSRDDMSRRSEAEPF